MCGLSGTVIKKQYNPGKKILPEDLAVLINNISKDKEKNINKLLDQTWDYKSNINFLRYATSEQERKSITTLVNKIENIANQYLLSIKDIDKTKSPTSFLNKYSNYEKLLDCKWFLSNEISNWFNNIDDISIINTSQLKDHSIIFYKSLLIIINSIDNRLEIRGRDSFGISIQIEINNIEKLNNDLFDFDNNCFIEEINNKKVATFIFKTANSIGSLGDNAKEVKKQIRNNSLFQKI